MLLRALLISPASLSDGGGCIDLWLSASSRNYDFHQGNHSSRLSASAGCTFGSSCWKGEVNSTLSCILLPAATFPSALAAIFASPCTVLISNALSQETGW